MKVSLLFPLLFCLAPLRAENPDGTISLDERQEITASQFVAVGPSVPIAIGVSEAQRAEKIILTPLDGFTFGVVTASSSASWVRPVPSENRPGEIDLYLNATGLSPATYSATITITAGQTTQTVSIQIVVGIRPVTRLIADPVRPLVYGLRSGPSGDRPDGNKLVVMNSVSGATVRELDADRIYSISLSPDSDSIYGVRSGGNEIIRYDLRRMVASSTGSSVPTGGDLAEFTVGPHGTVFFLTSANAGLTAFDTTTGTTLQTISSPGPQLLFQHLSLSPDGRTLYANQVRGSGAYTLNGCSTVISYSVGDDGNLVRNLDPDDGLIVPPPATSDQKLSVSADGRSILCGDRVFKVGRGILESTQFFQNLVALAPSGEYAVSAPGAIFSSDGLRAVAGLPLADYQRAGLVITPDGRLFYSRVDGTVGIFDMRPILGDVGAGFSTFPESSALVSPPVSFRWLPIAGATEYRVYASRNSADLQAAIPPSETLVAKTNLYTCANPFQMRPGETWFWRADSVTPGGLVKGIIKSFGIGGLIVDQDSLDLTVVKGCTSQTAEFKLSSPSPVSWTATTDQPSWLAFEANSGTTPSTLRLKMDTRAIGGSLGAASVYLRVGNDYLRVTLKVRPVLTRTGYVVSAGDHGAVFASETADGAGPDFLVKINPSSGEMLDSRLVGSFIRDVRVSPDHSTIAVISSGSFSSNGCAVRVLDVDSFRPLRALTTFERFPDATGRLGLGPDGLMMLDQRLIRWPDSRLLGLNTQESLQATTYSHFSPDGKAVFGQLSRSLSKLDLTSPGLPQIASRELPVEDYARNMRLSQNGEVITVEASVYDSSFNPVAKVEGDLIQAINDEGSLAYLTGGGLVHLPTFRPIPAVAGGRKSAVFCDSTRTIVSDTQVYGEIPSFSAISYAEAVRIDPSSLTPGIPDGSLVSASAATLRWNDLPASRAYHVFFGTDSGAVAGAAPGDPLELGVSYSSSWAQSLPLDLNTTYYWKLIVEGEDGQVSSQVWSFHTATFSIGAEALNFLSPKSGFVDLEIVQINAPAGVAWSASSTAPWLRVSGGASGSGQFTVEADPALIPSETGVFSTTVTVVVGSQVSTLPVTFRVATYHVLRGVSDRTGSYGHLLVGLGDYAADNEPCYLGKIDMKSHRLVDFIDAGVTFRNTLFLMINPAEDRVYLGDYQRHFLRGFNRSLYKLEKVMDTNLIEASIENVELYEAAGVGAGKIAIPGKNEISVFSTETGQRLSRLEIAAGGYTCELASSADGRILFAQGIGTTFPLTRFSVGDDGSLSFEGNAASGYFPGGSGLKISDNGQVVYAHGSFFTRDLTFLSQSGSLIWPYFSDINYDGTIAFASGAVRSSNGSVTYGDSHAYAGYGMISDPFSNTALSMYDRSGWVTVLKSGEGGLPSTPGSGWVSSGGGEPWAADPQHPDVLVSRNLINAESPSFSAIAYLAFRTRVAGTLTFEWRNVTGGGETFTFSDGGSTYYSATAGTGWTSRSVFLAAGDQGEWVHSIDGVNLDPGASAEIRNVTFTPAAGAASLAVIPATDLDTDHDGTPDFVEAALGSDPASAASRPVVNVSTQPDGSASFIYRHPVDSSYQLTVQISDDLLTWQDLPSSSATRSALDSSMEEVRTPLPAGRARQFARLRIDAADR